MHQWRLLLVCLVAVAALVERAACDEDDVDKVLETCSNELGPEDQAQLESNMPEVKAEVIFSTNGIMRLLLINFDSCRCSRSRRA